VAKKSFKMCIVCVPSFGGIKRIGYCLELLPLQFDGARVATRRLLTETIEQSSVDYSNFPETSKWLRRLIQKKEHCDNYFITGFARSKHSTARSTQLAGRWSLLATVRTVQSPQPNDRATACPGIVLRGQRTLEKCSVVRRATACAASR